ncbi:MAG: class I SAM-dependent methyltransferase [Kiritimatiellae bacterium]|nr:class I SAM-dependent methyltransferase [Kiritimatiellia bacterium]
MMSPGTPAWKKWARRAAKALGIRKDPAGGWHVGPGRARSRAWYDKAYARSLDNVEPCTQSLYYPLWCVICERLVEAGARSVLEIGCGSGQLARMLLERGIQEYVGLDFSREAITAARLQAPGGRFIVDDARTSTIYADGGYDGIVCTEVLEHVEEDLTIVGQFPRGVRCLCSVPNFDYPSHVRFFENADAARARYQPFFDGLDVLTVHSPRKHSNEFYLLDGIRNDTTRHT